MATTRSGGASGWPTRHAAKRSVTTFWQLCESKPVHDKVADYRVWRIRSCGEANVSHRPNDDRSELVVHLHRKVCCVPSGADHGRGIPPACLEPGSNVKSIVGVGIAGMRERMRQLGCRVEIESGDDGTCINATIPIGDAKLVCEHDSNHGDTDVRRASSEHPIISE